MKSSISIKCSCGCAVILQTNGTTKFPDTTCPQCHAALWIIDDGIVSTRVFNRALAELRGADFTLSIILSAMSVECDLARLYIKWNKVDLIPTGVPPTQTQEDSWEQNLRNWTGIIIRLDKVCEFLTSQDFDSLVTGRTELATAIRTRHPASIGYGSVKKFFQEHLFWKRNQVVHFGKIDFGRPEAEDSLQIAATLFQINQESDRVRIKQLPTM